MHVLALIALLFTTVIANTALAQGAPVSVTTPISPTTVGEAAPCNTDVRWEACKNLQPTIESAESTGIDAILASTALVTLQNNPDCNVTIASYIAVNRPDLAQQAAAVANNYLTEEQTSQFQCALSEELASACRVEESANVGCNIEPAAGPEDGFGGGDILGGGNFTNENPATSSAATP